MKKKYINYKECHKIINNIEYKMCKDCKEWFEMNETNFKVQPSQKDGYSHKCRKCQEEYNHNNYMKNREREINRVKERRSKDPSINRKNVEHCKKKYHEDPIRQENVKKAAKKSRENGNNKKWQQRNKDKLSLYNQNRRHKKHNINNREWIACKDYFKNDKDEWCCAYCGMIEIEHKIIYKEQLHKEHVDDKGANNLSNCIPSCKSCNSSKHTDELDEWYNKNNLNFTHERYNKIIKWITEDYKQYIEEKKPKKPYERKSKGE